MASGNKLIAIKAHSIAHASLALEQHKGSRLAHQLAEREVNAASNKMEEEADSEAIAHLLL